MNLVEEHPDWPWDWHGLSQNLNITPEFIEKHQDELIFYFLSQNPAISCSFIEKHPDWPWDWRNISANPNITPDFVLKHQDKLVLYTLWQNQAISKDFLSKHFGQTYHSIGSAIYDDRAYPPINRNRILPKQQDLSRAQSDTFELIRQHPHWPWDWYGLSWNPQTPFDIIEQNTDKPWNWERLGRNPNLTEEFIEKHKEKWNLVWISRNKVFTWSFFEKHLDWPWDWTALSYNYNITFDFIEQNLDREWDWYGLSMTAGRPIRSADHAKFLREKHQVISPLKNKFLHRVYLNSPVTKHITYFPLLLKLALPLPAEMIYEISFLVYFQN